MAQEVETCLTNLNKLNDIRVLILTGEGSPFGPGADLKARPELNSDRIRFHCEAAIRIVEFLETSHAPVIAVINSPAFADSFKVALGCDIRIASELDTFALNEVRNAGSFPAAG